MSHAELLPLPSPHDPGMPPSLRDRHERPVHRSARRRPATAVLPAPSAPDALSLDTCEHLFVSHLHVINRIAMAAARRSRLNIDEAEDFSAMVRLKLVQHDYAILRRYHRRCALGTFLTVVIRRMLLDYCRSRWGRWRPTMAARRQGSAAVLLQQLTVRDGLDPGPAGQLVDAIHGGLPAGMSAGSVTGAAVRRPRLVGLEAAINVATPRTDYDERVLSGDFLRTATRSRKELLVALGNLRPVDRRLLTLRFVSGLSVAQIARGLATPQKPLYRQIYRLLARMRADLEHAGVSAEDIRGI